MRRTPDAMHPPSPPQMEHQQRVMQVWAKYKCNPFKSLLGMFVQVIISLRGRAGA